MADERFIHDTLVKLRLRLLDLTGRNPLISFKHSARSRRFIRVIDELPDQLHRRLGGETGMRFKSLGPATSEPEDEKSIDFRLALDAAKLDDPDYLRKLAEAGEDPGERVLERLEDELRVQLRERLGMPPRKPIVGLATTDVAQRLGLNPSFDLPLVGAQESAAFAPNSRHTDSTIQTLLFEDAMEASLGRVREQVRLSIDEAGVNPLFCVFGFLEWYEDGNSAVPLHAPLLLYPLNIDRKLVRGEYQYTVRGTGEEAQVNVALAERLKRDFQIHLPPFGEEDTPESYFAAVQQVISRQRSWKVRRWITVGLFSFARIAMYHDLASEHWDRHGGLHRHPGIGRLIGGGGSGEGNGETGFGGEGVVDGLVAADDAHDAELEIPLISDADSSQLAAIRDVVAGRNLVIEGPPGTGKSQTITNIIAAALAQGKSVLFLAEKMAALNVVRDRLAEAQLDEFCLELHSTKAGRRETLGAIARRLERVAGPSLRADLDTTLAEMGKLRQRLTACVEALGRPAGNLGITAQELLWRCHRARVRTASLPSDVDEVVLAGVDQFTQVDVGRIAHVAEQFETKRQFIVDRWGGVVRNPWYGVARHDMNPVEADDVVRRVAKLAEAAARAERARQGVTSLTGFSTGPVAELHAFDAVSGISEPASETDEALVSRIAEAQTLAAVERLVQVLREHTDLRAKCADAFADPASLDAATLDDLNAVGTAAVEAGLGNATVSQVSELAEKARQRASAWSEVVGLIVQMAQRAGIDASGLTPAIEQALVFAVDLAADASPELLARRTPELLGPDATDTLRRGSERLASLRERKTTLSTSYVLDAPFDSSTLGAHAAALRGAPALPFLSPRWWRARAAFKSIHKGQKLPRRHEMALVLDQLAELKDDLAAFQSDPGLTALAGTMFRGLDSDFAPAVEVAAWGDRVRSTISANDDAHVVILRRLREAPPEQVQSLGALRQHGQLANLKMVCTHAGRAASAEAQAGMMRTRSGRASRAKELAGTLRLRADVSLASGRDLADRVRRMRELHDEIVEGSRLAASALGDRFTGPATSLAPIIVTAEHVRAVLGAARIPQAVRDWLLGPSAVGRLAALRAVATEADAAAREVSEAVGQLTQTTPVDFKRWIGVDSPMQTRPDELHAHAARCAADSEGLHALVDDARLLHECRESGLGPLFDVLERNRVPLRQLGLATQRVIYQSMARAVIARTPALANFTGDRHEGHRSSFRDLDHKLKRLRQAVIAEGISKRPVQRGSDTGPRKQWTGLALLRNETDKQRAHVAIRDLMDRAGEAVKQLMPCFMMSPLSVAQYLKPGGLTFDLIIMDEASQLRPEDAIGAIARGTQLVVVGDPKQLPPTNFFAGNAGGAGDDDNDGADGGDGGSAADEQSILDQALAIMRPARRLKWHYRSRHPSLIAFSNKEFYDNQLILFPTPFHDSPGYGVRYVSVTEGRYRKGLNVPEARRVATEVIAYAAKHPDRSLGVVTMNKQQAELLSLEIDRLATENERFEEWRRAREGTLEPFFVKNLENVQGDERDAIFISTVYGRDEEGNFFQRFGPLVNEGGHRRLNVLFSRAKLETVVFSTMDPGEIKTTESTKWGVKALKGYLKYAKDGVLDLPTETHRAADSDFEVAVTEALRKAGFDAVPQVGVAGYFIDIGVRHPDRPGEYVLGVECDGAMYHSSKSARDRDRLRQEILERLRWRIHRIWSLDWYKNPTRETERLVKAVREAVAASASTGEN